MPPKKCANDTVCVCVCSALRDRRRALNPCPLRSVLMIQCVCSALRDLLRDALSVAQKRDEVLTVASQQVIRHLLTNEHLRSLDDLWHGQRRVIVIIFIIDLV